MNRAIFIDKDGTLIENIPHNVDPNRITLTKHAGNTLKVLKDTGYKIIVVTNQSGIARGYFKEAQLINVKNRINELLKQYQIQLNGFYYCPHHIEGIVATYSYECECRKPKNGMLLQAIADFDINPFHSWMIGDILHDIEAGNKTNCRTILFNNGNETEWNVTNGRTPDFIVRNFNEITKIISSEKQITWSIRTILNNSLI